MPLFYMGIILCVSALTAYAHSSNPIAHLGLANNSDYYLVLSTVDHDTASCSDECYPVLAPKKGSTANEMSQQWVDLWSTRDWIYVGYNVCQSVSYSAAGLPQCQGYLGHLGATFSPPKNAKFAAEEGKVNITTAHGNTLFIAEFVPDTPVEPIIVPNPVRYDTVPFRGNNIAAAEFSSPSIDWIIQDGFPNKEELKHFAEYGMNTYRIPIRWSYAQPTLLGPLNQAYVSQLVASSTLYLEAGFNVIVDLHSYMRFQPNSMIEPSHAGQVVNAEELTDIWDKLSDALLTLSKAYPKQLMFDLMNEPMKDLNSRAVLDRYNAVIKMLRDKDLSNLILLEGAHWSGMHSWLTEKDQQGQTNGDVFIPEFIKDPINHYAINVHQYFDSDHSGTQLNCTSLPVEKIKSFIAWADKYQLRFMVTELGGADAGHCQPMIKDFLTLIHGSSQLLGWTLWAGGRHWGDYMLSNYKGGGSAQLPQVLIDADFLSRPKR